MKALPVMLVCLCAAGCRDWEAFSANHDGGEGGGSSAGGGTAGAGGGGGAAGGAGGGAAGGVGGGVAGGAGGGVGGGADDPSSCTSGRASTCPVSALFCDGFETNVFNAAWTLDQVNGTMLSVDSCAFRGKRSARSELQAVGATVAARARATEGQSGSQSALFVRVFVRINPAPGVPAQLITVKQTEPQTGEISLIYSAGQVSLFANGGSFPTQTASFPMSRWVCVEWQLQGGTPGVSKISLDGVASAIDGPLTLTPLQKVALGAKLGDHAQPAGLSDVWFDELAVSNAPIGCGP